MKKIWGLLQKIEETLFIRVLGSKSPFLRILDFLMDNKAYDYSKIDIAKGAGISRRSLSSVCESLEKNGLAKETRKVGRAKKYKIDLRCDYAPARGPGTANPSGCPGRTRASETGWPDGQPRPLPPPRGSGVDRQGA